MSITKDEIIALLTQDSYYRNIRSWPLITSESFFNRNYNNREVENMFHIGGGQSFTINNLSTFKDTINRRFYYTNEILVNFQGHIIAAGGAICTNLSQLIWNRSDIDFFFYDLKEEDATTMRSNVIEYLISCYKNDKNDKITDIYVQRNIFVTTVTVITNYFPVVYQFIHRIYPNIASIIGGFDLSVCMIAYDGNEVYTTPLGLWSITNNSIIIDTKRRSESFSYRLVKYYDKRFRLIFPGLTSKTMDVLYNNITNHGKHGILEYLAFGRCLSYTNPGLVLSGSYDSDHSDYLDYLDDVTNENCYKILPHINMIKLSVGKLDSVISLIHIKKDEDIHDVKSKLLYDKDHPNLCITDNLINDITKCLNDKNGEICNGHYLKTVKSLCYEQLSIDDSNNSDIIICKALDNAKICENNLTGIRWITKNPGTQWTSSFRRQQKFDDPREWYGKYYIPVLTGIPTEIETCLRLSYLPKTESIISKLPKDVFDLILTYIFIEYANDGWKYVFINKYVPSKFS
jgi:hypothetical protein